MIADITSTPLYKRLREQNEPLAAKLLELRDVLTRWLSYVPATFGHYTSHTVRHSDEVFRQTSHLLFGDDELKPVVNLSSAEMYALAASAYLHDAGMVVSEEEKSALLQSDPWKQWADREFAATRLEHIDNLRQGSSVPDPDARHFLADLETRRLIADFFRINHPKRSAALALEHESALGRFAYEDPVLRGTIADLCLSHGLPRSDLDDPYRYPFRRDVLGEKVNVRFLAVLLRLGDLLDLSSDRACPLLLNAAAPLPIESIAHWSQYDRIVHRMTSPDSIEVRAECVTQDEHRVIQDWLQWLADECSHSVRTLAGSPRHAEWRPPRAELGTTTGSLVVVPASGATYLPSSWKLELDRDMVLDRLVHSVYGERLAFLRELLQNSFDAQRCQLYNDADASRASTTNPADLPSELRNRYPVTVELSERPYTDPISGEVRTQQELTVSDRGTGMDLEVIEKYFLQIGRSFYTTPVFRQQYSFVPTSRFGIGFLSVFRVSDYVTVETKMNDNDGVRLVLTGPRTYLLSEAFHASQNGTTIHIVLREPLEQGVLTKAVRRWCRRVEFPVIVDDLGVREQVASEKPQDFVYEEPDATNSDRTLALKAFPVEAPGVEGELYVFSVTDGDGESWTNFRWASYEYPDLHPLARAPRMPAAIVCANGILVDDLRGGVHGGWAFRVDVRRPIDLTLSRSNLFLDRLPEVRDAWTSLMTRHLDERPSADWSYRNELAETFDFLPEYWQTHPHMVPILRQGLVTEESLTSLSDEPEIVILNASEVDVENIPGDPRPTVLWAHVRSLADKVRVHLLGNRGLASLEEDGRVWRRLTFGLGLSQNLLSSEAKARVEATYLAGLSDHMMLGFAIHPLNRMHGATYFLNRNHAITKWLLELKQYEESEDIDDPLWERVFELLEAPLKGYGWDALPQFLSGWDDLGYPPSLAPPSPGETLPRLPKEAIVPPRVGERRILDDPPR